MVAKTQELCHSARNSVRVVEDSLGYEGSLIHTMAMWLCHIDRFEWQYDMAFSGNRIFGAYLMDHIRRCVQIFLHSCNTTSMDDVDTGALSEFG